MGGALFDLFTAWGPAWLAAITIVLNLISWYPLIAADRAHNNFTILARYSLGWIRVGFAIVERTPDPELWKSAVTGTATALSLFAAAIRFGIRRQDHWSNPLGHLIHRIDDLTTRSPIIH